MTSISITETVPSNIEGKVAVVTGGASGIGYAAALILESRGANVHILDIEQPDAPDFTSHHAGIKFWKADVTSWAELRGTFNSIGHVDLVFANAGVGETTNYFKDEFDEEGLLLEPSPKLVDVNLKGMLNVVKLAWHAMKKQGGGGSIVITTSATAYVPWQSLAVYSSVKLALVGIIRSLRSLMIGDDITINGVAPSATITKFLPEKLAQPIIAMGAPVSSAHTVGLALVHAATAAEARRVEAYGIDKDEEDEHKRRWNGRIIVVLGDKYTEIEETYSNNRSAWLGRENARLFRMQQTVTDVRKK